MLLLPVCYDTEAAERGVTNAGKQVAKGQLEEAEPSRARATFLVKWWKAEASKLVVCLRGLCPKNTSIQLLHKMKSQLISICCFLFVGFL